MESTRNRLIQLLAEHQNEYVSGQKLSNHLNISRSAIWKHMKELEKDGYVIEGISNKGYRITQYPNKLSENTIQWGLNTSWLGHRIIHKETTSTTQEIAHQMAQNNAKNGTVVIADEQTEGKGRMKRAWHSAKNQGIWMSMVLRPNILPYLAPQLTLLTATVLADVIKNMTASSVQIKWPNDILINNRKVAGILTEMQAEQDVIQYVVIGIGMNVNQEQSDFPQEIHTSASSIKLETNKHWDLTPFIQRMLENFEEAYSNYLLTGFEPVKEKWESFGYRMNQTIRVKTMKNEWEGVFLGIAEDGALLVTDDVGKQTKLYSAEISWFN